MEAAPSIEAVLFDFDGTLVETESIWKQAKIVFLTDICKSRADDTARRFHGVGLRAFAQAVIAENDLRDVSPEEIVIEVERIARRLGVASPPLKPGALSLVEHLLETDTRLSICSNAPADLISQCLTAHGLGHAFSGIFSSANTAFGKPNPYVYQRALLDLKLTPLNAVAVEDSASGIRSALRAGLAVVLVGDEEVGPDAIPSRRCRSLEEINHDFLDLVCRNAAASIRVTETEPA